MAVSRSNIIKMNKSGMTICFIGKVSQIKMEVYS